MNPNRQHEPRPSLPLENKAAAKRVGEDGDDDDDPEEEEGSSSDELGFEEGDVKKMKAVVSGGSTRRGSAAAAAGGGGGVSPLQCQAEKCAADLTVGKRYHRRHKVCEVHAKAPIVIVAGLRQRFCQQCSRFHELSEFDEAKRSCRRRLAGHNERRRKSSSEGSSGRELGQQVKHNQCRESDERGRVQIILPKSPTFKHFHIH